MNMSNYLAAALLNQVFRNTAYTRPSKVYLALYTSNPTAADTGQEVAGGGYARQEVTFGAPANENYTIYHPTTGQQVTVSKPTIKNSTDIAMPTATADWGQVSHIGIRDAATGGNLLYFGALETPRSILSNDIFKMLTGQIVCTLA
ncbi:phage tail fiber protein [Paenibacillus lautus]